MCHPGRSSVYQSGWRSGPDLIDTDNEIIRQLRPAYRSVLVCVRDMLCAALPDVSGDE